MSDKPGYGGFFISMALLSAASVGLYSGSPFWGRVALGICWVFSILTLLLMPVLLTNNDVLAKIAARPMWRVAALQLIDVPILIGLAGFGHWWTFGVFAASSVLSAATELKARAAK